MPPCWFGLSALYICPQASNSPGMLPELDLADSRYRTSAIPEILCLASVQIKAIPADSWERLSVVVDFSVEDYRRSKAKPFIVRRLVSYFTKASVHGASSPHRGSPHYVRTFWSCAVAKIGG